MATPNFNLSDLSAPVADLPAPSFVNEPDPCGYDCPECGSEHPARGASNKHFGARRCRWCQTWTKRMERAFNAAWAGSMADAMLTIRGMPWAEQNAARAVAHRAAGDAARAARLDVLTAAIEACAEARAEMAVVA